MLIIVRSHWYLAIICNVSKIERKPIVQDFDASQANEPQESIVSTTTTKPEADTTQKIALSPEPPVVIPETQAEPSDEEPSYLIWTSHHSAYDGYQTTLTLNMLADVYRHAGEKVQSTPSPPPIQRFVQYLQQKNKKQVAAY